VTDVLAVAAQARREKRFPDAIALLKDALTARPDHGPTLNALGLTLLDAGRSEEAVATFRLAATADPKAPPVWLNLAEACRRAGRGEEELAALDGALAADPYLLPALLRKAQAQERLGDAGGAVATWRNLLAASPPDSGLPAALRAALDHGRSLVQRADAARAAAFGSGLQAVSAAFPDADLARVQGYADHASGRRKVFVQQPTGAHFPYLPAIEYFDPELFPWLKELEAACDQIRAELLSIWDDGLDGARPYVRFEAGKPVNQWAELNHNPAWSAWFLLEDGQPNEANCARCPATAALLDRLPLLDIPGKSPTAMFSILAPKTRIPPHTGTSNVRTTIHLPLVVPPGCGFRVGARTREWEEGKAWAFDDTIEHEAWNDSERPRAVLIVDAWNPLLTEAERAGVRVIG
jgi:aspartyl/asparaginyl beta-hydroxylase (cupin superfamily)/Flp pilus assembly protein TadD